LILIRLRIVFRLASQNVKRLGTPPPAPCGAGLLRLRPQPADLTAPLLGRALGVERDEPFEDGFVAQVRGPAEGQAVDLVMEFIEDQDQPFVLDARLVQRERAALRRLVTGAPVTLKLCDGLAPTGLVRVSVCGRPKPDIPTGRWPRSPSWPYFLALRTIAVWRAPRHC